MHLHGHGLERQPLNNTCLMVASPVNIIRIHVIEMWDIDHAQSSLYRLIDSLNQSINNYPVDCKGAMENGHDISGVYRVQPHDLEPFDVSYYHGFHGSLRYMQ